MKDRVSERRISWGFVEVIMGPMFSGKTEELIRRIRVAGYAKQPTQVFKHILDSKSPGDENKIVSHSSFEIDAISVNSSEEIIPQLNKGVRVIGIDGAQFFDSEIVEVVQSLANMGMRVIIAGLDTDSRAKPYGFMSTLAAQAEKLDKLKAICMECGELAVRTQRIESEGIYEARCRRHYEESKD